MFTLVIGGAASGKSEFAEEWAKSLSGPRLYVATMQPFDDECRARIARHRAQRAGKGFDTLECYTALADAAKAVAIGSNVLLECMSNLVANELYSPDGCGADAAIAGVAALLPRCANLTVVTNEVFSGGADYAGDTLFYLRELARVNRELARRADAVAEIVCGQVNILKGREYFR
ncbi:MAG: bifunctional adenosylcobinamide kinase/adenosylcobinamide-phosphate guanylyltransferase [Clostridia bacterium]|nr:bifunctional adenosylcobinamide kinase/adenosylcobinamide-phosphate guanylyltransferase [Clostridia bacterium]